MKPPLFPLLFAIVGIHACKEQPKTVPTTENPDYKKAMSLLSKQSDSAFYYFNKVATGSKDSQQVALAYNHMAVIQSNAGDYYGSEENLLTSLKYLDEKNPKAQKCLISDYNELGRSSSNLKNYDAALHYYDLVIQHATNSVYKAIALNNQAIVYQDLGQYAHAVTIYQSIKDTTRKSRKEYARVTSNLARARWLEDSNYRAAPELWEALQIRREEKDQWGLNASYSHLSDYYAHTRPDSALFYAQQMYAVARQLGSESDQLEALQKLVLLSPAREVKPYFSRYQFLDDSLQTARNTSKNQFALIRFEAQKSKADNLRLQKDNNVKQFIIYGILVMILAIVAVAIVWYRKRKQQLELEARAKMSQKVHDVVANGLYEVMTLIEHEEHLDKERLADKVEVLYEQSRDLSYEGPGSRDDLQKAIASLRSTFASDSTKIAVVGNNRDLWRGVTDKVKSGLEKVLLELLVNMKKHSAARNVVLRFGRRDDGLHIEYTDDGVGLPTPFQRGNGLTNTETRIKDMGGRLTFGQNSPTGLKVQIVIPIADPT